MKVKQKIKEEPVPDAGQLDAEDIKQENEDLTLEDEERRRRRRERNKVAATKCRNKKKERTTLLIAEGEVLEIQNSSFKEELIRLEAEKRRLTDILANHEPTCAKRPKLDKAEDKNKNAKDVFKVPTAPPHKDSHPTHPKVSTQKLENFERKYSSFSANPIPDPSSENAFSNEFNYFNYNEGFRHQTDNNMFSKQQNEQQGNQQQQQQQQQQHGYFNYNYYGSNIKTNLLENHSQPLSLSSYGFNGVDNMCVAL